MISLSLFEFESEPPLLTGWFRPISSVSQTGSGCIIFLSVSLVDFIGRHAAPLKRQDPCSYIKTQQGPVTPLIHCRCFTSAPVLR